MLTQEYLKGSLLLLIYINDLRNGVPKNYDFFANDKSLLSVVNDIQSSAATLRNHLTFNDRCSHHIETSQLTCRANQLTGFYIMGTLAVKRLMVICS